MGQKKRILFAGYAPVHFLCFRPVYEALRASGEVETWLSGGFRRKDEDLGDVAYELEGFYEPFGVDLDRVAPFEEVRDQEFDAVVCAHSSSALFPRSYGRAIQVFHGVSFKNFAVREKARAYDVLCLPGRYHGEQFVAQGITEGNEASFLLTGFPKLDALLNGTVHGAGDRDSRLAGLGLDPSLPTVLFAPTGGKHNALDSHGPEIVEAFARDRRWNLLVKPHDHPKKRRDWFQILAHQESERVRLVRDFDIVPYLRAADLLLTDASSVALEFTLLDRPIVFVDVPKLFANVRKRGGALDLETHGRKIGSVAEADHVVEAVADAFAHPDREREPRSRAAAHLFHDVGHATERVTGVVRSAIGLETGPPAGVESITPWRASA